MGAIKKGLFKVFWRGRIKQYSCEMGFGKYSTLELVGRGLFRGGQAKADGNGCEQTESARLGQILLSWTLSAGVPQQALVPVMVLCLAWGAAASSTARPAYTRGR